VGFEDGDYPSTRATEIVGIECIDQRPANPDGVETGKWVGDGVCLFVAADGKTLTSENSTCPNSAAVWFELEGEELDINGIGGICVVDLRCLGTDLGISENDGYFPCITDKGVAEGWFTSKTSVHGNAAQILTGAGEVGKICQGMWTAAPE